MFISGTFGLAWCCFLSSMFGFFPKSKAERAISKIPAAFRGVPPLIRHPMPMQFPTMSASGSFAGAGSSFLSLAMFFGYVSGVFPFLG